MRPLQTALFLVACASSLVVGQQQYGAGGSGLGSYPTISGASRYGNPGLYGTSSLGGGVPSAYGSGGLGASPGLSPGLPSTSGSLNSASANPNSRIFGLLGGGGLFGGGRGGGLFSNLFGALTGGNRQPQYGYPVPVPYPGGFGGGFGAYPGYGGFYG